MKRAPRTSQPGPELVLWRSTKFPSSQNEKRSINGEAVASVTISSDDTYNVSAGEDRFPENDGSISTTDISKSSRSQTPEVSVNDLIPSSPFRFISPHPLGLTPLRSLFLDHYLNNFSLKYPTYLDPSNPFLSTLVPLALRSSTVLCVVLAIGGLQTGLDDRPDVKAEILILKGRALRGCRSLLHSSTASISSNSEAFGGQLFANLKQHHLGGTSITRSARGKIPECCEEDDLMLFASVMLLMVHDKLSGEPCSNLRPHLKFAHQFERRQVFRQFSVHHKFLRSIFLYNDLLAAISSGSLTLRDYGQNTGPALIPSSDSDLPLNDDVLSMAGLANNRYYLPILLSRIANGSSGISLADIERWDGNMFWLPSFSSAEIPEVVPTIEPRLTSSIIIAEESETVKISEIYRNAARVFYYQRLRNKSRDTMGSTSWKGESPTFGYTRNYDFQIQHFNSILLANLRSLPLGSAYESSLLFPIGIAAMEIRDICEKAYILSRLQLLEDRFQLSHFRKFREKLSAFWEGNEGQNIGQRFTCDAILLG